MSPGKPDTTTVETNGCKELCQKRRLYVMIGKHFSLFKEEYPDDTSVEQSLLNLEQVLSSYQRIYQREYACLKSKKLHVD